MTRVVVGDSRATMDGRTDERTAVRPSVRPSTRRWGETRARVGVKGTMIGWMMDREGWVDNAEGDISPSTRRETTDGGGRAEAEAGGRTRPTRRTN